MRLKVICLGFSVWSNWRAIDRIGYLKTSADSEFSAKTKKISPTQEPKESFSTEDIPKVRTMEEEFFLGRNVVFQELSTLVYIACQFDHAKSLGKVSRGRVTLGLVACFAMY